MEDQARLYSEYPGAGRADPVRTEFLQPATRPNYTWNGYDWRSAMLRLFYAGWLFHLKTLTNSTFFLLIAVLQPVIFASIAFFMFKSGSQSGTLLYAALGAGLMGIWSSTLFGSGGAIQWQRWQGTLEILIAAPAPFLIVLVPLTLATASIGLYSI